MREEQVEEVAKRSDMTKEEVLDWLAEHNVNLSDFSMSDVGAVDVRTEDKRTQDALDRITEEYSKPEDMEGPFVYTVCEDLGIRYKTRDVYSEAKAILREEEDEE